MVVGESRRLDSRRVTSPSRLSTLGSFKRLMDALDLFRQFATALLNPEQTSVGFYWAVFGGRRGMVPPAGEPAVLTVLSMA